MALNIFAPIATAITGAAKAYSTLNEATKKNTTTSTKTPTFNEHADYINKTYTGGLDAYTKLQNDRYSQALQNNNVDLLNKLNADSQRVGYKLTNPNEVQQLNNQPYLDQIAALTGELGNYQNKLQNIEMPKFDTSGMKNIQDDLSSLLGALQGYQGASSMSMDESMARAYSQLNGIYNANLDKTLSDYNRNAVSRGMFGQLPVEALKQNAISETELNKSKATNDLASNMYSQDFNMARQKDNDFYSKIGQQAGLLGNLYNTEADQYKNKVNEYLNTVNLASMQDNSYYDSLIRQLDLLGTQNNVKNNEMDRYAQNIGQFSNDYMAEINKIQNDNDPTNDWKIGYLQNARNQKVAGIEQGQAQAQAQGQEKLYNQAMDMFGKLGYASGWVAETLGLPEGTNTYQYANILADNARQDARLNSSGSSGGSSGDINSPNITIPQKLNIWQQATELARTGKQGSFVENSQGLKEYVPYEPSYDEIYSMYLKLATQLGYDPYDLQFDQELIDKANNNGSIWDMVENARRRSGH